MHNKKMPQFLLILLLSTDILFVLLHILYAYLPAFSHYSLLNLGQDRGFSELFQYVKLYWLVLIFALFAYRQDRAYRIWSFLFFYLLLDDSLEIREEFGGILARDILNLPPRLLLRPVDYGELLFSLAAACIFLFAILMVYRKSSPLFRQDTKKMLQLILCLAFFGVVVDMLHIMIRRLPAWLEQHLDHFFAVIEDGGEMVVLSVILFFAFSRLNDFVDTKSTTPKAKRLAIKR